MDTRIRPDMHAFNLRAVEQYVDIGLVGQSWSTYRWKAYLLTSHSIMSVALLIYEYALTFDRELRMVWQRKFNNGTVLFAVNRYLAICYGIALSVSNQAKGQDVGLVYYLMAANSPDRTSEYRCMDCAVSATTFRTDSVPGATSRHDFSNRLG